MPRVCLCNFHTSIIDAIDHLVLGCFGLSFSIFPLIICVKDLYFHSGLLFFWAPNMISPPSQRPLAGGDRSSTGSSLRADLQ